MNKVKLILSLSLCFGLVACESNENHEDNPPKTVNQLDRTQADYTIEEIKLPDEFTEELIAEIAMPFGKFIQIFHEEGYQFKLTLNDARKSRLYPVDTIYDYNLLTNKLTLIDPPIEADMYRVLSHVVDKFGGEYDLIEYIDNGQLYKRVFYNGVVVEEIENNIDNPFFSRGFQKLNGEIYIFAETAGKQKGMTTWGMYELNQGKAEMLFQYDNVLINNRDDLLEGTIVSLPPIQQLSRNRMAYEIKKNELYFIQLFDGNEVTEIQNILNTPTMIPLEDYVLYYDMIRIDGERGKYRCPLYQYDIKNKTITRIEQLDYEIGMTYHVQGNEFYHTIQGEDNSINVCKAGTEKLKCRRLDEFIDGQNLLRVAVLDEKTDFIFLEDSNYMPHFYLIHWQ